MTDLLRLGAEISLRRRIELVPVDRKLLNEWAATLHYMRKPVFQLASPFGWAVKFDGRLYQPDGRPSGFIIYQSPHFTKMRGVFGYEGLPTQWQVLVLGRLWLHDNLPKLSESVVIGRGNRLAPARWLKVHPPRDASQPYRIEKILSYCDLSEGFAGTVYEAANFKSLGETVSKPRHKTTTRGPGMEGHTLRRYVYDVPQVQQRKVKPLTAQLALFAGEAMPQEIPVYILRWLRGMVGMPLVVAARA